MKLYTYNTAAEILDCSAWKVKKMVLAGEIPYLKVGNETRIREEDLKEWIDSRVQNCRKSNRIQAFPTTETISARRY